MSTQEKFGHRCMTTSLKFIRMTFKFIYRILIVVFSGRPLHIPDICFFVCFFLHRKEQYTLFLMSPFTRFCIRFENFVMTLFQMESVNHCLNGQWSMVNGLMVMVNVDFFPGWQWHFFYPCMNYFTPTPHVTNIRHALVDSAILFNADTQLDGGRIKYVYRYKALWKWG